MRHGRNWRMQRQPACPCVAGVGFARRHGLWWQWPETSGDTTTPGAAKAHVLPTATCGRGGGHGRGNLQKRAQLHLACLPLLHKQRRQLTHLDPEDLGPCGRRCCQGLIEGGRREGLDPRVAPHERGLTLRRGRGPFPEAGARGGAGVLVLSHRLVPAGLLAPEQRTRCVRALEEVVVVADSGLRPWGVEDRCEDVRQRRERRHELSPGVLVVLVGEQVRHARVRAHGQDTAHQGAEREKNAGTQIAPSPPVDVERPGRQRTSSQFNPSLLRATRIFRGLERG
mmetsp:Transcript_21513/g.60068  ORF Transcript_21513/g.60068 Transcript_21513/m.60068 type:complete len:283 (-) Transcript_21513:2348-3196(-)